MTFGPWTISAGGDARRARLSKDSRITLETSGDCG